MGNHRFQKTFQDKCSVTSVIDCLRPAKRDKPLNTLSGDYSLLCNKFNENKNALACMLACMSFTFISDSNRFILVKQVFIIQLVQIRFSYWIAVIRIMKSSLSNARQSSTRLQTTLYNCYLLKQFWSSKLLAVNTTISLNTVVGRISIYLVQWETVPFYVQSQAFSDNLHCSFSSTTFSTV